MAKERYVNTKFWDDSYVINLDPIEKLLFLYFLTNPLTNISGVYEISLKRIAFDTGIDKEMVAKILARFEDADKIKYLDGWVAIKNFTKHQKNNPKINAGIENELMKAPGELAEWINISDRLSIDYESLSYINRDPNRDLNTNTNISNDIPTSPKKLESVPYDEIVATYHKYCPSLPTVRFLTDKRKRIIKSRWKTYKDILVFTQVFQKAEASDFLSGRNGKWTSCSFDWLLNEANMVKVLEGNYDNKGGDGHGPAPRTPAEGYGQGSSKSEYAGFIGGGG